MQGGAWDGIRVSCEVRNESVDVKREIQQKDMLTESFSPCSDFEGHMQKHRKGG